MSRAPGTRRRLTEQRAVFAVPGDLNTLTGGYAYARRMLAELGAAGWDVRHLPLGEGFPDPTTQTLAHAYRLLASQPEGVPLLVDGLALGAMPGIAQALNERQPLVALVHHPLALAAARFGADDAAVEQVLGAAAALLNLDHPIANAGQAGIDAEDNHDSAQHRRQGLGWNCPQQFELRL